MWHRVYLGRYASQAEAKAAGQAMMAEGKIAYFGVKAVDGQVMTATRPANNVLPPNRYVKTTATKTAPNSKIVCQGGVCSAVPETGAVCPPGPDYGQPLPAEVVSQPSETVESGACPPDEGFRPYRAGAKKGFNLSGRTGLAFFPQAEDFQISRTSGTVTETWKGTGSALTLAIVPSYRFNQYIALEGYVEKPLINDWNLWFFGLGPKVTYPVSDKASPYLYVGPVLGTFSWNDTPGSFSDSLGWEIGTGVDFDFENFTAGFGLGYRGISFKYNAPFPTTSSDDRLDFSGLIFSAKMGYTF